MEINGENSINSPGGVLEDGKSEEIGSTCFKRVEVGVRGAPKLMDGIPPEILLTP